MERSICRLVRIFEHLGEEFSVETFGNRLTLQKIVYFLQLASVKFGYRFSWYHYGPYSADLTKAAFKYAGNKEYFDHKATAFIVTESGIKKLAKVREIIEPPQEVKKPDWLELLASIHYIKHFAFPYKKVTRDSIAERLAAAGKPDLDSEFIISAWDALARNGLIDSKTLQMS